MFFFFFSAILFETFLFKLWMFFGHSLVIIFPIFWNQNKMFKNYVTVQMVFFFSGFIFFWDLNFIFVI